MVAHADPGVRGRALDLLAGQAWLAEPAVLAARAREGLADAHPYVRAQAADVLARMRQVPAIHRLMHLVDDMQVARYDCVGWTTLDGSAGRLEHTLSGRRRVAEAALFAIRTLSALDQTAGNQPAQDQAASDPGASAQHSESQYSKRRDSSVLVLTIGGPHQSDEDVSKNAEVAKAWYQAARARIANE